jgi:hypothetical protein
MLQREVGKSSTKNIGAFSNTDNKGKLWSMLQNNGAFNGISNTFFSQVRQEFESMVVHIDQEHREKEKMEKNKLFIDAMIDKMTDYRRQSYQSTAPYTASEIKKSRMEAFENDLSKKQDEFNKYTARPTPNAVDFKDNEDENTTNVNDLLERAIRDRENLDVPPPPIAKREDSQKQNTEQSVGRRDREGSGTTPIVNVGDQENSNTLELLQKIMKKLELIEAKIDRTSS